MKLDLDRARARQQRLQDTIIATREQLVSAPHYALRRALRGTVEELWRLQIEMDEVLELNSLREPTEPVWVELRRSAAAARTIGISGLTSVLQTLQRAVTDVLFLEVAEAHTLGLRHASAAVKRDSQLSVRAWDPQSGRIAIGAASPQFQLEALAPATESALRQVFWCAEWAERRGTNGDLANRWPSPAVRRRLATRVCELAPRKSGPIGSIAFSGALIPEPEVVLSERAHEHLSRYVDSKKKVDEKQRGRLVMVDVERLRIHISVNGLRLHCRVQDKHLPDAKKLLEREVEVSGTSYYDALGDLPYRLDVDEIIDLARPRLVKDRRGA